MTKNYLCTECNYACANILSYKAHIRKEHPKLAEFLESDQNEEKVMEIHEKALELKKEEIEKLDSIGCILAEIEKTLTKIVEKIELDL